MLRSNVRICDRLCCACPKVHILNHVFCLHIFILDCWLSTVGVYILDNVLPVVESCVWFIYGNCWSIHFFSDFVGVNEWHSRTRILQLFPNYYNQRNYWGAFKHVFVVVFHPLIVQEVHIIYARFKLFDNCLIRCALLPKWRFISVLQDDWRFILKPY